MSRIKRTIDGKKRANKYDQVERLVDWQILLGDSEGGASFATFANFARFENSGYWPAPEGSASLFAASANFAGSCRCQSNFRVGPVHSAAERPASWLAVCCFAVIAAAGRRVVAVERSDWQKDSSTMKICLSCCYPTYSSFAVKCDHQYDEVAMNKVFCIV